MEFARCGISEMIILARKCVEDKLLIYRLFSKNNRRLKIPPHICFQTETKLHLDSWHMTYIQYISINLLKKHITNWIECQIRNTMPDHLCDAPCCTIYSTILFDLDIMSRHLKPEMPNTSFFFQGIAWQKVLWLITSPKKAN